MIFDKKVWKKHFDGFTIHDCAIFRRDGYCFLIVEEKETRDPVPETKMITIIADRPITPENVPLGRIGNFSFSTIACGTNPTEYVVVDSTSKTYSANGKSNQFETSIENLISLKSPLGTMVTIRKVVRAAGKVYAVGNNRRLYRREGMNRWVDLRSEGLGAPMPSDYETKPHVDWGWKIGFKDLSAFGTNDFYAAGGQGDLWRFDGKAWHQCPLPTNAQLETVCCAGDGKVYVSDLHGNVWTGREEKWAQIAHSELAWGFQPRDAFWFKGRMYFGAQEGLYAINRDKELVPLDNLVEGVPSSMVTGRIDISPDGNHMLTAGPHGACLFDGEQWTRLFSAYDFR